MRPAAGRAWGDTRIRAISPAVEPLRPFRDDREPVREGSWQRKDEASNRSSSQNRLFLSVNSVVSPRLSSGRQICQSFKNRRHIRGSIRQFKERAPWTLRACNLNSSDDEPVSGDQAAIASGLARGERTAWEALYDLYSVRIWRYVARLVGNDQQAITEVVQEVFLAAAQSARGFQADRGTLWSWLTGIAQHQIARTRNRRNCVGQVSREADRQRAIRNASPDSLLIWQVRNLTNVFRFKF